MADRVLHGIPDSAQVWKIGGTTSIIFVVPGTDPPVYMRWSVPSDREVEAIFGPDVKPKYDRTINWDQWKQLGGLTFGTTDDIPDITEDPFSSWERTMKTEAASQPWILEPDYQRLIAEAAIEGRPLTDAEIQSTSWWKNHTKEEREWMKLYHGDRDTALSRLEDNRIRTIATLREAGVENPSAALVNYMADQVTKGTWSTAKFQQQVTAVADPFSGIRLDAGLAPLTSSKQGTTQEGVLDVEEMARRWLGPVHGAWSASMVSSWAGKLRNDPDAETTLTKFLQKQRMSLFPEYEDETLTYDDIASPWRNFVTSVWGQQADETDPLFSKLIKQNDIAANGALLRKVGFQKGVGKVVQDAQRDLLQTGGGAVRRALQ